MSPRRRRVADDEPPAGAQRAQRGAARGPARSLCPRRLRRLSARRGPARGGARLLRRRRPQGDGRGPARRPAARLDPPPPARLADREAGHRRRPGRALAGGFLLAQMADLCVAATDATFAITEARWGRGAPWAAPLAWMIPPRVALELLVTAAPDHARSAPTSSASSTSSPRPSASIRRRARSPRRSPPTRR